MEPVLSANPLNEILEIKKDLAWMKEALTTLYSSVTNLSSLL
jgi:hypothetical protein